MFDDTKFNLNVNMSGKEYIEYKKSKQIKISNKLKKALPYFIGCFVGIILITILIEGLTYKKPQETFMQGWYQSMPLMVTQNWNNIAKFTFLAFAPFLVIVIGLAWLFHGFGFLIIKG